MQARAFEFPACFSDILCSSLVSGDCAIWLVSCMPSNAGFVAVASLTEPPPMSEQDELRRRMAVEVLELEVLINEMEREERSLAEHLVELRALLAHLRQVQSQISPPRTAHH